MSIGYTIPKAEALNIADVTVSLVGRNLWMIYCEAPFDPEAVATTGNYYQGIDNFMMPGTRNLGFNVRLKFNEDHETTYNKICFGVCLLGGALAGSCTGDYMDYNRNWAEVSPEETERDEYLVSSLLGGMQSNVIPSRSI